MNHLAKCCRMKGKKEKGVLKAVEKDSDSSDVESLCGIRELTTFTRRRRWVSS